MTRIQRRLLLTMQAMIDRGEHASGERLSEALGKWKSSTHRTLNVLVDLGHVRRVKVGRIRSIYEIVRPVDPLCQWFAWDPERQALREIEPRREAALDATGTGDGAGGSAV